MILHRLPIRCDYGLGLCVEVYEAQRATPTAARREAAEVGWTFDKVTGDRCPRHAAPAAGTTGRESDG